MGTGYIANTPTYNSKRKAKQKKNCQHNRVNNGCIRKTQGFTQGFTQWLTQVQLETKGKHKFHAQVQPGTKATCTSPTKNKG